MKFEETYLSDNILDALYDMRFEEMTPIQEKCIPEILDGHDVLGVAQTGTGKTAAYLLPVLSMLDDGGVTFPDGRDITFPRDAINCIVMSPTRELAQQIDQAMQGFSYYLTDVSSIAIYGGNDGSRYEQEHRGLTLGADVVIATPGRLISHLTMGNADFSRVSFFILDEADRMLDMGFSDDILKIARHLPPTCQTIMFSATMPEKIEELAKTLLKNPVEVKIAVSKPAEKIRQSAYMCYEPQKIQLVRHLFKEGNLKRVIIFGGKKQKVKLINRQLQQMGISSGEMHSDLEQAQRDDMMYRFKSGQIDVLVATDIVSRGIDIDDIAMVINYDVPHDAEDYVHRIGRTARAERDGIAITFITEDDIYYFNQIERLLEKEVTKNPLPEDSGNGPEYRVIKGGNRGKRSPHSDRKDGHKSRKGHARKPQEKASQPENAAQGQQEQQPRRDSKKQKDGRQRSQKSSKPHEKRPAEQPLAMQNAAASADKPKKKKPRNHRKPSDNRPAKPAQKPVAKPATATSAPAKAEHPAGIKKLLSKPLGWLKKVVG